MDRVSVRKARRKDLARISKSYRVLYLGDEKQKFYGSKLTLSGFRSGQIVLVAEIEKTLVGYCWAVWYEHIKNKGIAYIEELQVEEKHRSKGIGKALIKEMVAELKKVSVPHMYCAVGRHMKESQRFYRNIGFSCSREEWFEKEV